MMAAEAPRTTSASLDDFSKMKVTPSTRCATRACAASCGLWCRHGTAKERATKLEQAMELADSIGSRRNLLEEEEGIPAASEGEHR